MNRIIAVLALLLCGCGGGGGGSSAPAGPPQSLTFTLKPEYALAGGQIIPQNQVSLLIDGAFIVSTDTTILPSSSPGITTQAVVSLRPGTHTIAFSSHLANNAVAGIGQFTFGVTSPVPMTVGGPEFNGAPPMVNITAFGPVTDGFPLDNIAAVTFYTVTI